MLSSTPVIPRNPCIVVWTVPSIRAVGGIDEPSTSAGGPTVLVFLRGDHALRAGTGQKRTAALLAFQTSVRVLLSNPINRGDEAQRRSAAAFFFPVQSICRLHCHRTDGDKRRCSVGLVICWVFVFRLKMFYPSGLFWLSVLWSIVCSCSPASPASRK